MGEAGHYFECVSRRNFEIEKRRRRTRGRNGRKELERGEKQAVVVKEEAKL